VPPDDITNHASKLSPAALFPASTSSPVASLFLSTMCFELSLPAGEEVPRRLE